MSCGKPHETPCTEVLEQVYWYLDGQVSPRTATISGSTSTNAAPACASSASRRRSSAWWPRTAAATRCRSELRTKVLVRIRQVQAEIELIELAE